MSTTTTKKPLVIFCHGSGDTGEGAKEWIHHLLPREAFSAWSQFDWIFPTAPPIPYQLNGGQVSTIWYDRVGGFEPTHPEHTASVEQSTNRLLVLLKEESERRGASQIIIGGFSMGGAIALQTAARWHAQSNNNALGGVFGLSCYLNNDSQVWTMLKDKQWPPTFIAHGEIDDFILPQWGMATYERMLELGVPAKFRLVSGVQHEMVSGELEKVLQFLKTNMESNNQKSASASNEL